MISALAPCDVVQPGPCCAVLDAFRPFHRQLQIIRRFLSVLRHLARDKVLVAVRCLAPTKDHDLRHTASAPQQDDDGAAPGLTLAETDVLGGAPPAAANQTENKKSLLLPPPIDQLSANNSHVVCMLIPSLSVERAAPFLLQGGPFQGSRQGQAPPCRHCGSLIMP